MTIDDIKTWGGFKGKKELLRHLAGEPLRLKQSVLANCYSCNAGYADGRVDCETPVYSHYGFMPDRENETMGCIYDRRNSP